MRNPEDCEDTLDIIAHQIKDRIFDLAVWGKDRAALIERAWEIYQEQSPCGKDRHEARGRIFETFILPYFKGKSLTEIDEHHIRDWWTTIPKTFEPSYQRVIRATLKAFLNFNRITRQKMFLMPKVKVPKKSIEWLKRTEQEHIISFMLEHHRPIFKFMCSYGCRVSEAANLRKSDIDSSKDCIIFRERKNFADNVLPIFDEARSLIKPGRVTSLEYVFCTAEGDKYSRQVLYRIWTDACKIAGVKPIPLKNATRHSLACQLLNKGKDIPLVARILGISSSVVVNYYGTISIETLKDIQTGVSNS